MTKRTLITAALPYANGPKHIGHLAGAYLPADVYARFLRLQKKEVLFVCGSDEHGTAIANQAIQEGKTPRQIIDTYHQLNLNAFKELGISFDFYHRTSDPLHHETAQAFFLDLYNKGAFIEEESEQYYDAGKQQFLADRYISGTCPKCGNEHAFGDQCERCGSSLSPNELINPRSTLSGDIPVLRKTRHWYLPLNQYESWLKEWIIEGHKEWKSNVYGQVKSWLDSGLQPRAVTRDLDWGVKVPLPDADGKVLYVWFDAPIGYISATRAWAQENNRNWEDYWKSPDTRLLHFIGKDNIVFHCIIFPVMLKAAGTFVLPDNVPANEFMNLEGDKMSTSRRWSIEMDEYNRDFPGKPDVLRYALMSILPESKDSEFTWSDFQARNNNELVAILGNFINRCLVLCDKFFGGKAPGGHADDEQARDLKQLQKEIPARIAESLESFRFREALQEMMNLARGGNKYLADTEPWKKMKTNPEEAAAILALSLKVCEDLCIVMAPFLPFTADKLRKMLNIETGSWSDAGVTYQIVPGHALGSTDLLFEKLEDEQIATQVTKLHNKAGNRASYSPTMNLNQAKEGTSFDDFSKMDLRIAKVLHAERVPKTDKLLKLHLNTGIDERTVVSGIAQYYQPESLIGKQVLLLANLIPRKIKGIESYGMLLLAENPDGSLRIMQPEAGAIEGAVVK